MKDIKNTIISLWKSNNWDNLARAFANGDIKWHAKEWKAFIENIQKRTRADVIRGIKKGTICLNCGANKKENPNWSLCDKCTESLFI